MKDTLQAIALGLCLALIAVALTASGTFGAGPARAFGQAAAPVPAVPEAAPGQVKLPGGPDRRPITCALLRELGAGVIYLERFGCYPPACLRMVQAQVSKRAALRAARKGVRP
jgi:hypothetical protein